MTNKITACAISLVTALTAVGLVVGGLTFMDARHASVRALEHTDQRLAETMQSLIKMGKRFEESQLRDRLERKQERLWKYRDRYGPNCGPVQDTCRALDKDIKELERVLKE